MWSSSLVRCLRVPPPELQADPPFPATVFIHVIAIVMTAIMLYSIQVKYTAIGRKEIVIFFWLYAIIQFLAIFLDGGIIPFDNTSYPVSRLPDTPSSRLTKSLIVVRCGIYRPIDCCLWFPSLQLLCRFPIHRRRLFTFIMVSPTHLPPPFRRIILHCHCHFQRTRWFLLRQPPRPLHRLPCVARRLRRRLHPFAIHPCLSNPG
jgi:hypothetical protein